jgi:hypothetical protein
VTATLDARRRTLRDIGFHVFPPTRPKVDPAAALLRSHYLVLQTTHVLG